MTSQQVAARPGGPSDKQIAAMRARAKGGGVAEAEVLRRVGATAWDQLNRQQIDQVFAMFAQPGDGENTRQVAQRPRGEPARELPMIPPSALRTVLERMGYTEDQQIVIRAQFDANLSEAELLLGLNRAFARKLDPLAEQVYIWKSSDKVCVTPSIDGHRLISKRSGEDAGMDPWLWRSRTQGWIDVWSNSMLDESERGLPPVAARCTVYRLVQGIRMPFTATVNWDDFNTGNSGTWGKRPAHQLAIAAERHARRIAFSQELADFDLDEPPIEKLESNARTAIWTLAATRGWSHEQVHTALNLPAEKGALKAAVERGDLTYRDALGRIGVTMASLPAPAGERQLLRRDDSVGESEFSRLARGIGHSPVEALRLIGEPDDGPHDWPDCALRLRAVWGKIQHDRAVDNSMPEAARAAIAAPGAASALYPDDPEPRPRGAGDAPATERGPRQASPTAPVESVAETAAPSEQPENAKAEASGGGSENVATFEAPKQEPDAKADTRADIDPTAPMTVGDALAPSADIRQSMTPGELRRVENTGVDLDGVGAETADSLTGEILGPDETVTAPICYQCGAEAVAELDIDGEPTCQQCFDDARLQAEYKTVPLPDSVRDLISFSVGAAKLPDGGLTRAEVQTALNTYSAKYFSGRPLVWKNLPAAELARRWRWIQLPPEAR